MKKILFLFLIILLVGSAIYAEENSNKPATLAKPMVDSDIWIDANRMNGVYRNNGTWLYDNVKGTWGLEWPKGSGLSPIFAGGQWVGAIVDGEIRVAGVQHSATEFQPGTILEPFSADNPRDGNYKWYSITPSSGDWSNWPFDQGAPYVDDNGNGAYDAGEQPQLIGDITAYSVWNDLAPHTEYTTDKLSVEVGQTVFAFNRADALGDMQFVKWRLVNKSGVDWDSTYFSIWLDPDVGGATDDLVGCDPGLGLGYCYNGAATDQSYGSTPPATGIDFFQGPIIDNPDSTVVLPDGTVLEGKSMLKMTSFVFYNNNDDPVNGNPQSGKDVWNFMRSIWRNDQPITQGGSGADPEAPRAYFMFDGDPETGSGWLDDNADDRRFLMTTGPFSMEAWDDSGLDGEPNTGDDGEGNGLPELGEPGVQDIVAAIMLARDANNLKSVTKLKEVDILAQLAYDLNFKLANAPLPPNVEYSVMPNEIVLEWDNSSEWEELLIPYNSADPIVGKAVGDTVILDNIIQTINDSTYNFYGYTVYQYSDASGADPVQLAHWDVGPITDPVDYKKPRFLRMTENKNPAVGVVGNPLTNGKEYYFGVVAEGYLKFGSPRVFQSPPTILSVTPSYASGTRYQAAYDDTLETVNHVTAIPGAPLSDANTIVRVVDPAQVTGHDYEISFDQQHYYRDITGEWKTTNYPDSVGKIGKPGDVTGSEIIPSAIWNYDSPGTVDLICELSLVSSTGAWVDGVQITLPAGVTINYVEDGHPTGGPSDPTPTVDGQTIMWGNNDSTEWGGYTGGEVFVINVAEFTPPITIDYIIYDDAYESGGNPINAVGQATVDEINYEFKTVKYMNIEDVTTNTMVLENNTEVFPPGTDPFSAPVVDGLQVIVVGSYSAPTTIGNFYLNGEAAEYSGGEFVGKDENDEDIYEFTDYTYFGFSTGTSSEKNGYGTSEVNSLIQDYEFRWTGELDSTTVNDSTVYITKDGTGSMATFYGARQYDWGDHPLNPNPGTQERFLVRVPFEVWNIDEGIQVNYQIYDRDQSDPTVDGFYVWNPYGRMYTEVINTPYDESAPQQPSDEATWNHVWYLSLWRTGDVTRVKYDNPIQLGVDLFTFSTQNMNLTEEQKDFKTDLDKIKVVPNPYYGYHSGELDPFDRWVQFTYIPPNKEVTIRIFDLAGNVVWKETKNDDQSLVRWDMHNEYDLPVASGVYVYQVEVKGVGEKIGKIAIFSPNERLDTY